MTTKVSTFIAHNALLQAGKQVLVALSGGADSVALLHVLQRLGYQCVAAHCNFHLRGAESNRDENFVRDFCLKLDIPLEIKHFDTHEYANSNGVSIEMAARELRYQWFDELAEQGDFQAVAIAHHADDNIETLLLNIMRGTGLRGLTAIPMKNGKIVRPLLGCTRKEIEQYVSEQHLQFVTDSTNLLCDVKRNAVRNKVLPLLETINPSVRNTLYANIDRWTETEHYYIQHINNDIAKMVEKQANGCWHINKSALNEPAGNTHLFLFEILSGYGFNPQTIRQIDDSINETSGRQFFSKTHRLINDRDVFILEEIIEKQQDNAYLIELDCIEITNPIHLDFKKRKKEKNFVLNKNKNTAQLDLSKLTFPLEIRKWQNGDSFVPFGMTQRQKISDFLINNKLSIPDKERVWLLLSGNEIAWIVGMRIDNRFCIDESTQDVLEITVLSE